MTRLSTLAVIYLWRKLCSIYTFLRFPHSWSRPSLMLRFETPRQKQAYLSLKTTDASSVARLRWSRPPRILIVIPFRDKWSMTAECLDALMHQDLEDASYLVALVDNGSTAKETAEGIQRALEKYQGNCELRHLRYDVPFNFSRLNNLAVDDCRDYGADLVCFLNNDVVMTHPNTLRQMANFLLGNPLVGSVGCSLLYPNHKIQHLFIAVGCKIVGAHPFKGCPLDLADPWFQAPRPVGAATAALLMMRRDLYGEVGGFEESLPSCYQDVDLALKVQQQGYVNWVLPWITAIHHETQTRSPKHSWDEVGLMYQRWQKSLTANPYHSQIWSRWSEPLVLTLGEGDFPWENLRDRTSVTG